MINSKWCKRLNKKINWAQHEEGRNMDGQAIWIYCNFLFAQQQQLQNRSNNNSIDRSQPEEEEDQQQPINILLINIQPGLALLLSPSAWRSPYVASSSIIIIKLKFHNLLGCVHGGKIITCTTTAEGRGQRLYQAIGSFLFLGKSFSFCCCFCVCSCWWTFLAATTANLRRDLWLSWN